MKDNKKHILFYMHAGAGNHGCEAIVRSLCGIMSRAGIDDEISLLSNKPYEDYKSGLDKICTVLPAKHIEHSFFTKAWFYAVRKILGKADAQMSYSFSAAKPFDRYRFAVSIGGDNYCYDDALRNLTASNHMFNKLGVTTALIGCSIEPELLKKTEIVEDMCKYNVIVARESISYEALKTALAGSGTKVYLCPDPAFTMKAKECVLPAEFEVGNTIGINTSPIIMTYENNEKAGIILNNYKKLIRTIIDETEYKIALIPHVVTDGNNDQTPLKHLYEEYKDTGRVFLVEEHTAEEQKYIISKCRFLIASRTHATIAAYSTGVPTLVTGYSVKARGIATDLFPGWNLEDLALGVQNLNSEDELSQAFRKLASNEDKMKLHLSNIMPEYIARAESVGEIICQIK